MPAFSNSLGRGRHQRTPSFAGYQKSGKIPVAKALLRRDQRAGVALGKFILILIGWIDQYQSPPFGRRQKPGQLVPIVGPHHHARAGIAGKGRRQNRIIFGMFLNRHQAVLRAQHLRRDQRRPGVAVRAEAAHRIAIGFEHAWQRIEGQQPRYAALASPVFFASTPPMS